MCVKYSSSPLGEGKGGSRYIQRTKLPALGPWIGDARPPQTWDVTEQVWGLGWGVREERAFLVRRIRMGSWGQDAWVSPFPCCRLKSCAVLSFFFFNCDQSWGRGTREGPWKGLLPGLGAVMGAPPSYGAGTEPQGKLLINCWLF